MMVESLRLRKKLCARKAAAGGPEGDFYNNRRHGQGRLRRPLPGPAQGVCEQVGPRQPRPELELELHDVLLT